MGDPRRCTLCGQPAEAYEHAASLEAQFATAMLALAPGVWLVAYPGTPLAARYRLGRHEAAGGADRDQEVQGGEAGRRGQPQA